jgi:hypothetical protein
MVFAACSANVRRGVPQMTEKGLQALASGPFFLPSHGGTPIDSPTPCAHQTQRIAGSCPAPLQLDHASRMTPGQPVHLRSPVIAQSCVLVQRDSTATGRSGHRSVQSSAERTRSLCLA